MSKLTLGKKFYKKFADLRESAPNVILNKVEAYLKKIKVDYEYTYTSSYLKDNRYKLIADYFRYGYILTVNPTSETPVELIGKGVCFDTGGYSLKPAASMPGMYFDKTGAILAIATAIDTGVRARVFFVFNDLGILPGSIVKEQNTGKRIYIDNTDAEGRIGLADLLSSSTSKKIITIATLTGAAIQAMGERTYALIHSNNKDYLIETASTAIVDTNIKLWPMPGHEDYDKAVLSKIKGADITNCANYKGAGSQTAFSFLKHFIKEDQELIHLDMAAVDADEDGNNALWGVDEVKYLINLMETQ